MKTAKKLTDKKPKTDRKMAKRTYHDHDPSTVEEEWQESGDSLDDISDDVSNNIMSDNHEIDESKLKKGDCDIINFP
ncbi:hypothetical protein HHI36_016579 [Cryptolaemus montrouzieri]|uniref:Uncharacterized protein n=1 Tax=Cryptolaemus montrouzieri TaxID=559131 RepID=A0ABD2NKW8_9CUCU